MLLKRLFYNEQEFAMGRRTGALKFLRYRDQGLVPVTREPDSACLERETPLLNRGLSGRRLGGGVALFTQFGLEGFGREPSFCPE